MKRKATDFVLVDMARTAGQSCDEEQQFASDDLLTRARLQHLRQTLPWDASTDFDRTVVIVRANSVVLNGHSDGQPERCERCARSVQRGARVQHLGSTEGGAEHRCCCKMNTRSVRAVEWRL